MEAVISETLVPFTMTVCGIEELGVHCERGVSHVVSILDPAAPLPPAFGAYGEHERIELRFDDVIDEAPDKIVPDRRHVGEMLAFGRGLGRRLAADAGSGAHLLVHCHMGISRSTAAMILVLAQARPDWTAAAVFGEVLRIRDRAWPNLRMLELGDSLLGRNGALAAAAATVYREQLNRRPQLERFFIENGRAREVELALGRSPKTRPQ